MDKYKLIEMQLESLLSQRAGLIGRIESLDHEKNSESMMVASLETQVMNIDGQISNINTLINWNEQ